MTGRTRAAIALQKGRLRNLREQRGWSQRELARRCGFAEALVSKYENGDTDPSSTALKAMAESFGVSTDYLVGLTDELPVPINSSDLSADEQTIIDIFRREGWRGVIHFGVDWLAK